jgi:murein DD-endopeptidase MepM/ murein hydrolase activator NlpD
MSSLGLAHDVLALLRRRTTPNRPMKRTFALAAAGFIVAVASEARAVPVAWMLAPVESPEQQRPADAWGQTLALFFEPAATKSGFLADAFDDGDLAVLERLDPMALALDERGLLPGDAIAAAGTGCELTLEGPALLAQWESDLWRGAPWTPSYPNGHFEKDGTWVEYDQIPRRDDRPEAYLAYRYPIDDADQFFVASGYDLDKPDPDQRRGKMSATGHGGVDLAAKKGTAIKNLRLEHQLGETEVLYVGWLFGESVVTRHTIREGGRLRDYVLIFGHLREAADGLRRGLRLRSGQLVGFVGDTASPEFVHLHLEARRVREGVDAWKTAPWSIHAREISTVSDPRNVLPLRNARRRAKVSCAPKLFAPRKRVWFNGMTLSIDAGAAADPSAP